MCGIAGYKCFGKTRPAVRDVQFLLESQEVRGRSAAGVGWRTKAGLFGYIKAEGPASKMIPRISDHTWEIISASPIVLLHARAWTKGSPTEETNNHPVVAYDWMVTHNGVISNDDDLIAHLKLSETRPAAVDTVAINTVLAVGRTWEESIGNLSTLTGSASIAALRKDAPDDLLLARVGGPPVYLGWDHKRAILFWASEPLGLGVAKTKSVGPLPFALRMAMYDDTAILIQGKQISEYALESSPFVAPRVYQHTASVVRHLPTNKDSLLTLRENYEGKPSPELGGQPPRLFLTPMEFAQSGFELILPTSYGRWILKGYEAREFKPHKRVRNFWEKEIAGASRTVIALPASTDLREALDDSFPLEHIKLTIGEGTEPTFAYMCPFCGIVARYGTWESWGNRCSWCCIHSTNCKEHSDVERK